MEIIKAEHIITAAYEQFFGSNGIKNAWQCGLGLYFHVEIQMENFGYQRDGNTHVPGWERRFYKSLHFMVTARHEVFLLKRDDHLSALELQQHTAESWENTSNHDSCWREDGLREIWETLRQGHAHCWDHVPDKHRQSMKQAHRYCSVNTGVFSRGLIQLVRVETERDPQRSGWLRLKSVKRAPFRIAVEEESEETQAA